MPASKNSPNRPMSKKNDLALQSAMRTIMGSQGLKAMRTIMDSPGLKAMREFMDSPASKVMHNPVDMPTQRAMRTIIDSPGLGATYEAALVNQRAMLEAARVNQWMSRLGDTNNNMLLAQMPKASAILEQNERIRYATASMASTLAGVDHPRLSGIFDLNAHLSDATEATRLKLAMLAGAGDVLG